MRMNEMLSENVEYLGVPSVKLNADEWAVVTQPIDCCKWESLYLEAFTMGGLTTTGDLTLEIETALSIDPRSNWSRAGSPIDLMRYDATDPSNVLTVTSGLRNWFRVIIRGKTGISAQIGQFQLSWSGKKRCQ